MAKKPNIRFAGFEDDWEQRKLGDVVEFLDTMRKPLEGAKRISGPYPYYGASGIVDYVDGYLFDEELVLLSEDGANITDRNYPVCFLASGKYWVNNHAHVLKTKDGNENNFICNSLERKDYKQYNSGMAMPKLNQEVCRGIPISCPSFDEQKKIGDYFSNLDHLITLHQRKCDELKKVKKFMLQKMFPKKGEKNPEIRFDGFTNDWEQRKLGEIMVSLQNNTLSRANLSNETGIAKNVHYGDVLIKFGEVLDVSEESLPMISDEGVLTKYKASFLQNGDVIVADTAEDSTVGKCCEIAGLNDEVVLSGLHTIPYRPIEKFASGYLGYYLNSSAFHKQLIPLMQGIKVTSISKSAMQDTDIIYTKSLEEQGKIGNFFQFIDHLITLHQRKCEELKNVKKYMLQNMFAKGE